MSSATFIVGDTRDVTATLPDGSVDLIMTSPPFLALRSYLPADHPDKDREIGSEPHPAAFIDMLLALTAEWRRVLAPHGSLAVELGDTYSGSGGAGGDYLPGGLREGQQQFGGSAATMRESNAAHWRQKNQQEDAWPLAKSLALIPELYRIGLAYGVNPLTGQPSPAGRWRVRNVVRWVRPNPPVGALGDKFRPATSDLVIACTSKDRWFDLDAVREPLSDSPGNRYPKNRNIKSMESPSGHHGVDYHRAPSETSAGAPPLDWWNIPPGGYPGSHYAVYPPELCVRPIKAMCPTHVCRVCGQPRRRIVAPTDKYAEHLAKNVSAKSKFRQENAEKLRNADAERMNAEYHTLGWTDCGHGDYRPGVVLDPFAGSGTTLAVATGHGRDAIGIDIDERNADLAAQRIGMFLTVRHHEAGAA